MIFAKGLGPPLLSFKAEQHHKPLAITHKWITSDYGFSPYRIQDTISGLAVIFPGFLWPGGPYHTKLLTDAVLGQRVATSFSKGADFAPGFFFWGGGLTLGGTWLFNPEPLSPVPSLGISSAGGRSQVFCVLALSPNQILSFLKKRISSSLTVLSPPTHVGQGFRKSSSLCTDCPRMAV